MEFTLNAEDSYILIQSVYVTSNLNTGNQWTHFISTVKLTAELKYVVFDDEEGRHIDERKEQIPIHLPTDPSEAQPLFHLEKLIKNETFTLGINPERLFYKTLKLELQHIQNLDEGYNLEFNIDKYKVDD